MDFYQRILEDTGYKPNTTFWQDFSIAEWYGEKAIRDTYKRAFKEWKSNVVYLTELVLILNWKIWQLHDVNEPIARVYDELWREADEWCCKNLKGDEAKYYYTTTD